MQKTIRILAVIAAILVALSLLLLLVSIPLQRMLANKVFGAPQDVIGILPIVPWITFTGCFMLLGCAILAVVFGGSQKGGIWLEILVLIAVMIVLPLMNTLLGNMLTVVMGQHRGSLYVAANSMSSTITSYCMWPGRLGQSIILVVCGMSMAYKHMSKKLAKVTE